MGKVSVDVTDEIVVYEPDLYTIKCMCGLLLQLFNDSGDKNIIKCPHCSRRFFWEHVFKVFEVRELHE